MDHSDGNHVAAGSATLGHDHELVLLHEGPAVVALLAEGGVDRVQSQQPVHVGAIGAAEACAAADPVLLRPLQEGIVHVVVVGLAQVGKVVDVEALETLHLRALQRRVPRAWIGSH